MSLHPRPVGDRDRRRRRRTGTLARWLVRAVIAAVIFALGVAVGQALEDRPEAGEPVTTFGTIQPWTQTTTTGTTTARD